ncbi:MAG TPA: MBL fold metallo-hydrolase [Alphaproteobacteria bacterium]|nr:MBL fold metallo-hydrolase [Alphaproteobacteria bacterium]HAM48693.1 MBL fold metallo-hydrolase [Alphaproteobacteria bacterium]HBA43869.1 MBL fold metallo-hydrolase [Alphaproteobacteria bacterium]HCO89982.1 MBL fold metallo-hydrolase [Alphaproteobacteria bacterium]
MSLGLGKFAYTKGLHDLGNGAYAWLAPDGSWGWSNAGLIVDGACSLLVDTLFDMPMTDTMLAAMRDAEPAARALDMVVNTHANGDHCNGNACCGEAEIIASRACAEQLAAEPPEMLAAMQKNAPNMGLMGKFFAEVFAPFDFAGVVQKLPTRTFETELSLTVGDKRVALYNVGPAHTAGDTLVHVPADKLLYTGDILFIEGTPIVWAGPIGNWIAACDRILALDADIIVPGHGPITDNRGVRAVRDYLRYVHSEARKRYDAGLDAAEAARDIALGDYDSWGDAERIAVNVATAYREFAGDTSAPDTLQLFGLMAEIYFDRKKR